MPRPYPEHDKLRTVKDKSQCVSDFLDWLQDPKNHGSTGAINLGYYPLDDDGSRCGEMFMLPFNRQDLLARFFEIDLEKLDDEKRTMLDELRAAHTKPSPPKEDA